MDGGGIFNDFTGSATLINSTISGNTANVGGGILTRGMLTLISSTVEDNQARSGGGILSFEGSVTITNSTIRGNRATSEGIAQGGGINNSKGSMIIINSTVSGNTSEHDGAGIENSRGTLSLTNSTVSGNVAGRFGGGISNFQGSVTLTNSTINGNSAPDIFGGGGNSIATQEGTVTLKNTIVASSAAGGDCRRALAGFITSLGNNLASDGTCVLSGPGDLSSINPLLGSLADNGGPTETHALLAGSPAIDAVPVADCTVSTDQRGVARPQGAACDIGSYEFVQLVIISVEIDIKPGSDPNTVKPGTRQVIPVAVLGSVDFDATQVDSSTVGFGPNEATPIHDGHVEDVNNDGIFDMVFHFKTQDTGIVFGDTDAILTGKTIGGVSITGTDAIKTLEVGCK